MPDLHDAEDIRQDVFYEPVEANRLLMPIEHVTGWLFRVARNRITDLFRRSGNYSIKACTDVAASAPSTSYGAPQSRGREYPLAWDIIDFP